MPSPTPREHINSPVPQDEGGIVHHHCPEHERAHYRSFAPNRRQACRITSLRTWRRSDNGRSHEHEASSEVPPRRRWWPCVTRMPSSNTMNAMRKRSRWSIPSPCGLCGRCGESLTEGGPGTAWSGTAPEWVRLRGFAEPEKSDQGKNRPPESRGLAIRAASARSIPIIRGRHRASDSANRMAPPRSRMQSLFPILVHVSSRRCSEGRSHRTQSRHESLCATIKNIMSSDNPEAEDKKRGEQLPVTEGHEKTLPCVVKWQSRRGPGR